MFITPTTRVWKQMYDEGKLKPPQTYFWEKKPVEELYDLQKDPDEVKNLAGSVEHQAILEKLRNALHEHTLKIRDAGLLPEPEQMARAGDGAIYDMAQDPAKYPVEKVLAMAEAASSLKADANSLLNDGLKDTDSGVRYWAAMGLMMRGQSAVESAREGLRGLLKDSSPSVRIAAAEALGRFGNAKELEESLSTLKELAVPRENPVFVSTLALTVIDALGEKAESLKPALKEMKAKAPPTSDRNGQYIGRILSDILKE
jgi:uncharacterized sulfatase